ncbi:zinc ribbon domain-containing protein [Methanobacterium petrolearium]|uniref:zinc ribbon domain-containing protein n=1 Tax=Methanobacterium petrolearium TaxID=710190 RepID=UPI001AE75A25|nr:zinc ribbon domain-containing protein [Methanobacterium petrolearium]MBP1945699.1 hypothetical protein [Methanobacterium petrolearium]BDZ71945.1 hypothetical protein GCM10025861_24620 [Methanobacterium petrolearium]
MDTEEISINYCPECGEHVEKGSKKCGKCGTSFDMQKESGRSESSGVYGVDNVSNDPSVSNVQPLNKLIWLIILTGGLYEIYWFYRNWRDFKKHKNLDISPGLRTVGLFIPLVNLYFVGTQFKDLKDYEEEANVKPFSIYTVIISWVVLSYLSVRLSFYDNPLTGMISLLLSFGLVIPFYMVQKTLNEYWLKEQGDLPLRKGLSLGEIIVLIIGLIFMVLEVIGVLAMFMMI